MHIIGVFLTKCYSFDLMIFVYVVIDMTKILLNRLFLTVPGERFISV